MPAWRKWIRAGIKLIGTGTGLLVATSPVHRGLGRLTTGDFSGAAEAIVYDTTGLSAADPQFGSVDPGKLIRMGVVVGVGIGLMKLFSYLSRRV